MKTKPKKRAIAFFTLIPTILILAMMNQSIDEQIEYIENTTLRTVPTVPTTWKGTPMDAKGNFVNLYQPFEDSFSDLIKWQLSKNPLKDAKKNEERRLRKDFDPAILTSQEDYLIWLGHASYLIQVKGKVLLIDPFLEKNTFLKRESPEVLQVEDLPTIDYLLLSHNHRDHIDKATIQKLLKLQPGVEVLTGLKVGDVIGKWGDFGRIQEAGWFQEYNTSDSSLQIVYVPSRHWSRRWLWDLNENLWGGFWIQSEDTSIYFMGDSGFGPHFEDIRQVMGQPDYCLMGVGAFRPEWFMNQAHISPMDAIEAFNSLGGSYFIPMHYGTFDLSDEPRMEPWDILVANQSKLRGTLVDPILGKNLLH
ncbi:MBL fold metallo-hydrolase [Mongoliitalea lutea]|nr:MBL fold metallo-hydrolase [Mongoliitalea lutea]